MGDIPERSIVARLVYDSQIQRPGIIYLKQTRMTDQIIHQGQFVGFTYFIRDHSGEIVEYSDLPITYIHGGRHDIFPQIESALEGKKLDDEVEIMIPHQDAFGEHDPELAFTDDLSNAPEEYRYVGAEIDMETENGEVLQLRVTGIEDGKIYIDANHPLAGKDITFVVKVSEVREPTTEELVDQPGFTLQ